MNTANLVINIITWLTVMRIWWVAEDGRWSVFRLEDRIIGCQRKHQEDKDVR